MLIRYLETAMTHARYEIRADDSTCYGEIPECQGVYAHAPSMEACRSELRSALEDWLLLRVYMHLEIPRIDGVELSIKMDREHILTPPVLYKYYAFNEWTRAIFERNEIYFQSPDRFNDPFDSKISTTYEGTEEQRMRRLMELERQHRRRSSLPEVTEEALRSLARDRMCDCRDIGLMTRTLERSAERNRKRYGIFCMTSKRDNILMWSHYAAAHTGFCLGFKTETEFFGPAHPVGYPQGRPCLDLIEPANHADIFRALVAKAADWVYEDEWRVITLEGPGIRQFPSETLSEVILGCRILPQNRHQIMQWCQARAPQPTVYWAEENDRTFALDIRHIS